MLGSGGFRILIVLSLRDDGCGHGEDDILLIMVQLFYTRLLQHELHNRFDGQRVLHDDSLFEYDA
jgi:hypothetical protein